MKYDSLSRSTVKITLSEEDMKEYSLCAENIALRTAETKRSLARLLRKMKLFPGYRPDRLFLEAFPGVGGGCVLYVSSLGEDYDDSDTEDTSVSEVPLMCEVNSLSALAKLCHGLKRLMGNPEACVYRTDNKYAIVVLTASDKSEKARHFLSEYGRTSRDPSEIYSLSEYAVPVCLADACEVFSGLY